MIQSMTSFARRTIHKDWGTATWEIRAVNHRYLELGVRLPDPFHELEGPVRERISSSMRRGKVECNLKYQWGIRAPLSLSLNQELIKELAKAAHEASQLWQNPTQTNLIEILSWPGVLQSSEVGMEPVHQDVLTLLDTSLHDVNSMRKREGQALQRFIEERLDTVLTEIEKIKMRIPLILNNQRTKLLTRIADLNIELNPERLEQECLLLAQKTDVTEELDRLQTHVKEVRHVLKSESSIGRQLDFLMQELNREANTLGSKSIDAELSHAAVNLKVLIEQMREQVQNIE